MEMIVEKVKVVELTFEDGTKKLCRGGEDAVERAWGTYPRILEEYVNNLSVISLETAIHKMTKIPATKFGIKNRGEIKHNYFADLVIFEKENIKDNSTFTNPKHGPNGIDYVFVNGKKSVLNGIEQNVLSGSTIRKWTNYKIKSL